MNVYYAGTRFCFKVPDAFRHEFQERNFMLVSNNSNTQLSIIYALNECSCKDGWVKFENIPHLPGNFGITRELLVNFLKKYYTTNGVCSFDESSLKFI